jgi:hypothetical protein
MTLVNEQSMRRLAWQCRTGKVPWAPEYSVPVSTLSTVQERFAKARDRALLVRRLRKESYSIQPDTTNTNTTTTIILLSLCNPLKRPVCSSSRPNTYASRRTAVPEFPSFSTATFWLSTRALDR